MKRLLTSIFTALIAVACSDSTPAAAPSGGTGATGGDASGSGGASGGRAGSGGEAPGGPIAIDLGAVQPDQPTPLDIPEGTVGFNLVVQGTAPEAMVGIRTLQSPSGELVLEDWVVKGAYYETSRSPGIAAVSVPQSILASTDPVEPGPWTATFSGTVDLHATAGVQVTSDGGFHGGTLDLHLYIAEGLVIEDPTPSHIVDAAAATSDEAVAARLDAFFTALEGYYGIGRGQVSFHGIDAKYLSVKGEEPFAELFSVTSAAESGPALHMVWAQEVEPVAGYPVWGVSSGLPGAANLTGTRASGVALAISEMFPAAGDGLTMLHEAGHFLGLGHTSELAGGYFDSLADTPECLDISEQTLSSCEDKNNLMFPVFYGATQGGKNVVVSEQQARVVHGSPVYRPATAMARRAAPPEVTFDAGALFGHPGVSPSGLELELLAALCGHEQRPILERLRAPDGSRRAELQAVATSPRTAKPLRALAASIARH